MKKLIKLSFDIVIDSEEQNLTQNDSTVALKNYIYTAPIEFLKNNVTNIKNINVDINSDITNAPIQIQQELPEQIVGLLVKWEVETKDTNSHFYGYSLHIDSDVMNEYRRKLVPHESNDAVYQTRYTVTREEFIDITNIDLIQKLKQEKTILYNPNQPLPLFRYSAH
jgi:hypothetical protein